MTQQTINIGTVANDGTGDDLRVAMQKVNDNFTELYGASPVTAQITISGNEISSNTTNANLKLTASGTGVIEFEGVQIRDNHIEATRSNDDLILSASGTGDIVAGAIRVHGTTISSDDSTKITINEAVDVTGTLTVGTITNGSNAVEILNIDTNTISSSDSTAIQINDAVNISGILSANTIDTNTISSNDSSAVTISDNLQVNGTLTATSITGVTTLNSSDVTDGNATTATSAQTSLDTSATASYRSIKYDVSVTDSTNSRYALYSILITHDGSSAYISSSNVSSTGADLGTFDADISGGNVRLLVTPATSDSMTYKFIKTAIDV